MPCGRNCWTAIRLVGRKPPRSRCSSQFYPTVVNNQDTGVKGVSVGVSAGELAEVGVSVAVSEKVAVGVGVAVGMGVGVSVGVLVIVGVLVEVGVLVGVVVGVA